MHIVFLTDNFYPEGNAPAARTYEHVASWVKAGHQVTVITGAPNFPEGKVFEGYKNNWYTKELLNGIQIVRVKTYIAANKGFAKRILDFLSFMVTSFIAGLFQKKADAIIATSPQFFTAISGWLLSVFKRKPFIFELRDFWPASIVAVGAMKKSWVLTCIEKVELFLYHRADQIVVVTKSFKTELIARGIESDKISVVLNGVDLKQYALAAIKDTTLAAHYKLDNKFVAGYIGTHGMAHALNNVVEAAVLLKDYNDIRFVFAGSGAEKNKVAELVLENNLTNIVMIPRQPKEMMAKVWSLCDLSLVTLKNSPLFSDVIPSKIFESMGMGIPTIVSMPLVKQQILLKLLVLVLVVEPESPQALAAQVLKLYQDRDYYLELQANSVTAAKLYSRELMADKMLVGLTGVVMET